MLKEASGETFVKKMMERSEEMMIIWRGVEAIED